MELEIKAQLDRIEALTALSARNVLGVKDAVLLTGLSKTHLYRLTCTHQIPHYKPTGKNIYFDRAELENWMKQNRVATNEEIETSAINYLVLGKFKK